VAPKGDKTFGPDDLLTVGDVAQMRGIKRRTLNAYLTRGLSSAGTGWVYVGTDGGHAIRAADAVRG
jgi:hypothetical protein